ncbi:MAG: NADPH:quinone reductase [Alectoria fallacina]|uniref:Probable quinone oxidoreductase n=1 Tax=Alectoria fallacina TaxID=1903189 RepID=A0A8H3IA36_9LECA|nr:MAG: NADPH:quinone reductase [Alectoria fallacina]
MASTQAAKTMKGILIEKTGGTEVLQYKTDLPLPEPKEGEVLVKNDFIGINYIDTYFRTGLYTSPKPEILGKEASGIVVSPHQTTSPSFQPGDRVVWMGGSGYAEYTAAPAVRTIKIPDSISSPDACAAILQGLTALTLTEEAHAVKKGDWVLVLAASGGVGGWLCQILQAKGAHTIATVGNEAKVVVAKENGSEIVLVEGKDNIVGKVKELTGGAGVAAVFDSVGKDTFDRSLECVARKGTLASFGNSSGAVAPFSISKLSAKNVRIVRPSLFNYISTRDEFDHYANKLFKMMAEEHFKTRIHETYPLKDVARAHDDLEGRKTMGKLLMTP